MRRLLFCVSVAAYAACVPVDDYGDPEERVTVDLTDAPQRTLYGFQDRLRTDSLLAHVDDEAPATRLLVARAFGSIRSDSALAPLTRLLADPVADVRAMAAYALGQQGDPRAQAALLGAFAQTDTAGVYARANAAILEAAGKVGDTSMVGALAGVSSYRPADTLLVLGQARGLYRLGVRGSVNAPGTALMLRYATSPEWPVPVRRIAAHYLQRAGGIDLSGRSAALLTAIGSEPDRFVRMALIRGLGRSTDPGVAAGLAALLRDEGDALTRVELVRALAAQSYPDAREALLAALRDPSDLVAETAAETLRDGGDPEDATAYWRLAGDSLPAPVQVRLYGAAMRHLPDYMRDTRGSINKELRRRFAATDDTYVRADLLRAVGESPWNYRYLIGRVQDPTTGLVETTAAAEALDAILAVDEVRSYFRGSWGEVRREYADYIAQALQSDNPGLQAVAATSLARPVLDLAGAFDTGVLTAAQDGLDLPRDTETFYALEDARGALTPGYTARRRPPAYNHPITWDTYRSLQPGLEAVVETARGAIVIDLFEAEAPATVVNFVQLARNGYYNGKRFHRVVPGFVTQGGGSRGDGYGGLDYSIRTETPPLYYDGPGYVGMASAGPHTEGVQFFFTHQPTPHLDGRYTIFGRVVEGQDVVEALRVGDEMRVRLR